MASVELFGDWKKVRMKLARNPGARLSLAVHQATIRAALLLVRQIKLGIRNQAPGGEAFVPNAPSTIREKGSSKALIDTGFLVASVAEKILKDGAFVGLLRSVQTKDGQELANIGAIMEYGATIEHPAGHTIVIPPRPFLAPTFEKFRPVVIGFYRDALASVFG